MKGFVTIEGCEGVGKTTQIKLLKEYLEKRGVNAVFTREPGGSIISEQIRKIILDGRNKEMTDVCEALLYSAARNQHLRDVVIPALEAGKTVFCDRYTDSTFAYQGCARGLGEEYVTTLNRLAVGEYMPELTIFLDLDPVSAFRRKGGPDKKDRLETQGDEFFRAVYKGYLTAAEREPERIVRIDASGSKENTHRLITETLIKKGIINV